MNIKNAFYLFLLGCIFFSPSNAFSDELTPSWNLSGIDKLHEKIIVHLNLKGAEEFKVDAEEIRKILRGALSNAGVDVNSTEVGFPMIGASIVGESTGGGGARYTVEVFIRANIASPYAKGRSIQIILWYGCVTGEENMRYDSISKGLVKPTSAINDRVYNSVREVASRLASDFKKANNIHS